MRLLVTGGTGFIGRAVVAAAQARGHDVTVMTRDPARAVDGAGVLVGVCDQNMRGLGDYDGIIHLAWQDTARYRDMAQLSDILPSHVRFLQSAVAQGCTNITVAGTCLEYGLCEGACVETQVAAPVTPYGLAKKTLCDALFMMSDTAKWLRYFYVYGAGQKPSALLPQLARAVAAGEKTFPLSPGDQSRDFIHVATAAHNTVVMAEQKSAAGIYNIGNGRGVRVIDMAREFCKQAGAVIDLQTGVYPYAGYEPFSFHADVQKLRGIKDILFDDAFNFKGLL